MSLKLAKRADSFLGCRICQESKPVLALALDLAFFVVSISPFPGLYASGGLVRPDQDHAQNALGDSFQTSWGLSVEWS